MPLSGSSTIAVACMASGGDVRRNDLAQFVGVLLREVDRVALALEREVNCFIGRTTVEIVFELDNSALDHGVQQDLHR
jgi:hypothetical protein